MNAVFASFSLTWCWNGGRWRSNHFLGMINSKDTFSIRFLSSSLLVPKKKPLVFSFCFPTALIIYSLSSFRFVTRFSSLLSLYPRCLKFTYTINCMRMRGCFAFNWFLIDSMACGFFSQSSDRRHHLCWMLRSIFKWPALTQTAKPRGNFE